MQGSRAARGRGKRAGSIVPLPPHSICSPSLSLSPFLPSPKFVRVHSAMFINRDTLSRCRRCSTLSSALHSPGWPTFNPNNSHLRRRHRRHRPLHPAIFPKRLLVRPPDTNIASGTLRRRQLLSLSLIHSSPRLLIHLLADVHRD